MEKSNAIKLSNSKSQIITGSDVENRIILIRGVHVMIDRDLAELYGVETKRLNEQVKRNKERFPSHFMFQLSEEEKNELVAFCDRFKTMKHSSVKPFAFTEQGVAMLSSVLRSDTAVQVSIKIMDAFVELREFMLANAQIFQRLTNVEKKIFESDLKFERIFKSLEERSIEKKQGIFFDGQIYDAYSFVVNLIKKAEKEIILIDGYVDSEVLDMLSKKKKDVSVSIITFPKTKICDTDINRFNAQYPQLEMKSQTKVHDRFMIIDREKLYSIGASLKDLSKKCFSFSLLEDKMILENLLLRIQM
jgi:hypothetical protein